MKRYELYFFLDVWKQISLYDIFLQIMKTKS